MLVRLSGKPGTDRFCQKVKFDIQCSINLKHRLVQRFDTKNPTPRTMLVELPDEFANLYLDGPLDEPEHHMDSAHGVREHAQPAVKLDGAVKCHSESRLPQRIARGREQ